MGRRTYLLNKNELNLFWSIKFVGLGQRMARYGVREANGGQMILNHVQKFGL